MVTHYDILIIGGGVVGCAIARELSKYQLRVGVLEKEPDVGWGTSARNSGVVHSGFNNKPGSLMARLCVEGSQGFADWCQPLDVPCEKHGKLVVARKKDEIATLERLKQQGLANGVRNLAMITERELHELEPNIQGIAALYSPETAVTSPYLLTIALAENATQNGVRFFLNTEVRRITAAKKPGLPQFTIQTHRGDFTASYVINSAGVYADKIACMAGIKGYRIYPCRGEYHILDKHQASLISRPVYPAPQQGAGGLGVHFTTTVEGVLLIGPSAEYIRYRNNCATTRQIMTQLFAEAQDFLPLLSPTTIIRSYAGLRAKQAPPSEGGFWDYVIEESRTVSNFINLIGIESPGLTASQPIARMVREIIERKDGLSPRTDFIPTRRAILRFDQQDSPTRKALIQHDPDYGEVICRCENITRKEVLEAIHTPLNAHTLNSIKYRTRAMMGRCQGGYCLMRLVELLRQETGLSLQEIRLAGQHSSLFHGYRSAF